MYRNLILKSPKIVTFGPNLIKFGSNLTSLSGRAVKDGRNLSSINRWQHDLLTSCISLWTHGQWRPGCLSTMAAFRRLAMNMPGSQALHSSPQTHPREQQPIHHCVSGIREDSIFKWASNGLRHQMSLTTMTMDEGCQTVRHEPKMLGQTDRRQLGLQKVNIYELLSKF